MSIVAVSDVHLGMKGANNQKFIDFLESLDFEKISDFVLLGDIIDIWRRDFTKAVIECSKPLTLLNDLIDDTKIHYVVGNHDYYLLRLFELHGKNFPFEVKKSTVISSKSQEFFFFHGYQL
ncbi:MAG: metallophosphoesterase family protein, partial [Methanosarcinaceae archaeon]|nr:metallophosphoesterase family protein [Methanosarcinaceae archaeon]